MAITVRVTVRGSRTGGQTVAHESTGIRMTHGVLAVLALIRVAVVPDGVAIEITGRDTLALGRESVAVSCTVASCILYAA